MAAKAWSSQQKSSQQQQQQQPKTPEKAIEEVIFQNDAVSLCLLVNRRVKTMRVIDFRAGPSSAKRACVLALARREQVEKVYTLVERDEVATWVKLGFSKEGNIPGFYKRSDAFLLGSSVSAPRPPRDSETRVTARFGVPGILPLEEPVEEEREDPAETAAQARAEKTVAQAKKVVKELSDRALPVTKISAIREIDAKKVIATAIREGRALTGFEPFGRDVERRYFALTSRGGFELIASAEAQSCFGNSMVELLTAPKNEAERLATVSAVRALCEKLLAEGVVSCFSLVPSDDPGLAAAYVFNGFRRTGLLQSHIVVGNQRKDATIWSRKLANPSDD